MRRFQAAFWKKKSYLFICKRLPKCSPETIYYFFPMSLSVSARKGTFLSSISSALNTVLTANRKLLEQRIQGLIDSALFSIII